jgi:hypothetical protein
MLHDDDDLPDDSRMRKRSAASARSKKIESGLDTNSESACKTTFGQFLAMQPAVIIRIPRVVHSE